MVLERQGTALPEVQAPPSATMADVLQLPTAGWLLDAGGGTGAGGTRRNGWHGTPDGGSGSNVSMS